ncbi:MAG: hypothetical protein H7A51_16030 [Akkermansiaceae bacterium]|nr:hypothetical protein [Akkermansiaceae bacterium]
MNHLQKKSSFQSPEDYREHLEDAVKALEAYQRIRRPLMFHVFLLLVISFQAHFLIVIAILVPILGVIDCLRRLEDGFDEDETPAFRLSSRLVVGDSTLTAYLLGLLALYVGELQRLWFWKTWAFYPAMFGYPMLGLVFALFMLLKRGWFFFLDLFFLRCWDKWLKALRSTDEEKKPFRETLRGSYLNKLPQSAGSAPESDPAKETPIEFNWLKKKAGQAKSATKTFLEKCANDEKQAPAPIIDLDDEDKADPEKNGDKSKAQEQTKAKEAEKPTKDQDSQSTNKGDDNSK